MKRKLKLLTGAAVFLAGLCAAPGLYAGFNDGGLGARTAGMGQAFSAVSNDANAINTNPAGLAGLVNPELSASYGKLFTGLGDDSKIGQGYFGLAFPARQYVPGVIGIGWDELRLSEAYCETVFTGAYADTIYPGLSVGGSLKYLRKTYVSDGYTESDPLFAGNGYAKSGLGIDLGGLYRVNENYTVALVFKNINRPDMGLGSEDRLPVQARAGAAYWLKKGLVDLDVAVSGGGYDVSVGAERMFQGRYLFRLGFLAGNDSKRNASLGFGSRFGAVNFDYSFTLPLAGVAGTTGSHRLAFGFKFGEAERDADEEARRASAAAIRDAKARLAEQEEQIKALEQKVREQEEAAKRAAEEAAAKAAEQAAALELSTVPVTVIEPAAPKAAADAALELLKEELERSRKEAESFRERLLTLEEGRKAKAAAAPAARSGAYVVQEGDTLESIAAKVYGDGSKWPSIYKANAGSVGRGGTVKPGQTLAIP